MNGKEMVKIIDSVLAEKGMTQKEFCEAIGIQSSSMSGWRKGSTPTPQRVATIEKCLGISFADYEKSDRDSETDEVLQWLREDFSHRALFESAKGLTKEQAYAAASFIEKMKAGET